MDTNKHRLPCCVWTILVCGATFYIAVLIAWPVLVRRVDIGDAAWAQGEKSIFDLGGKSIAANEFKPVLAIPCYQDDGVDRRPVCDKKRRCGRFRMVRPFLVPGMVRLVLSFKREPCMSCGC